MVSETTTNRSTVKISNVPQTIVADELLRFLELHLGEDTVFALEIPTTRDNWKPRDFARVQFTTLEVKSRAQLLSSQSKLLFKTHNLRLSEAYDDIIPRPVDPRKRLDDIVLTVGFPESDEKRFCALEKWDGVRCWILTEKRRVEFWVWESGDCYKIEVRFEDIIETLSCCVNGDASEIDAFLLKLKYGPKVFKRVTVHIATKFKSDRYRFCKEDFDFMWIRTTDFSGSKSIGTSTCFCLEVHNGSTMLDIFSGLPYYREDTLSLTYVDGKTFASAAQIVPLLNAAILGLEFPYEILFQLNALVHAQKISLFAASDMELIKILRGMSLETALVILKKLHQQSSICYDPVFFVKTQMQSVVKKMKHSPASAYKRLTEQNIMSCQRAYVTPSKIYLLGPELETANYVVKNFAEHVSDFMRVTFVEEDWSKLPANALSVNSKEGYFVKPSRTNIYNRVLSILGEGITVGPKRFEFLAFSASQLRGNSVWMFASNEKVKAEDIREWMGCFRKIRSISKCAARMGQLFSASRQTLIVRAQDVEQIPDIEVTTDGADYCFSDGIGKISLAFAKQVAQKCGLSHVPSAFQIRYGGYKGVIAVDRSSFRKLSLRDSMLKFDSNNRMLNVTRWTESMPCFLNREIICLLSTLGIEDAMFEAMQAVHLSMLGNMLEDRDAALNVLQKLSGENSKNLLVKMLLQGYAPSSEPYLSMMLRVHHESQLSELKSRCRILVPKGRILIGCMDEMGILEYGQVYVRVTLTKAELKSRDQSYFRKIDEETSVVIGKVVVTKNPCLHPGDIRVLDAIYEVHFEEKGYLDCIIFPQKGERPHPNLHFSLALAQSLFTMSTVSSDPAHAKKSRNSRKALKQKNEIVESSPVSDKGKETKSFEKDLMEMQAMLEKMKIEKEKTEDLLKEKDEILRKKEVEQEKLKTELKKLQKMKEFKPNMTFAFSQSLAQTEEEKKGKKKKKDCAETKRPSTPYILWCKDNWNEVKKQNPEADFKETSNILGAKWKGISAEEKKPYEEKYQADKEAYLQVITKEKREREAMKLLDDEQKQKTAMELLDQYLHFVQEAEHDNKKKAKKIKDPLKPKQPISAYLIYANERRAALKGENKSVIEVAKMAGEEWKNLSEEKKAPYDQMAKKNKEIYLQEMEGYKRTKEEEAMSQKKEEEEFMKLHKQEALQLLKKKEKTDNIIKKTKETAKNKKKNENVDPNKPKKPTSSYFLFCKDARKSVLEEHPGINNSTVTAHISLKWMELGEEEKQVYNSKAAELMEAYKKEVEEYNKTKTSS